MIPPPALAPPPPLAWVLLLTARILGDHAPSLGLEAHLVSSWQETHPKGTDLPQTHVQNCLAHQLLPPSLCMPRKLRQNGGAVLLARPGTMAPLTWDALKHSTGCRHPDVRVCPQVPSLFPRVPARTASSDTPVGKLSGGDTRSPAPGRSPQYPLCALPTMTPTHGAATRPPLPPPLP